MKKLTKNTISLILAAIMLSSAFASCSEKPQDKTENKTAESQNISAEENETDETEAGRSSTYHSLTTRDITSTR